ncbi:MAG: hypothetical protein Kow0099_21680 [Candidatus Abyssubacteria bacterium]
MQEDQCFQRGVARRLVPVLSIVFFGLCCAYALYVHLEAYPIPYDDSFITFRYVSNFFSGNGLVYNAGERVFGSTTPLYVAWLIFLKTLLRDVEIPLLAIRGNIVFLLATAAGCVLLVRTLLGSVAAGALAGGLVLLRLDMLRVSLGGNETFLFCALVVFSFYFLFSGRYILAGALAGLSIMARPEGVFCALLVGLVWMLGDRKRPIPFIASVVLPGVVWTVCATAYYGTPIYHSLIAKSRPLYPLPPGHALHRIVEKMSAGTAGFFGGKVWLGALALVAAAGFALRKSSERKSWFVIPLFLGLIVLFYGVSNPLFFDWYFPIVFIGWYLFLMVGVASLAGTVLEGICGRHGMAGWRVPVRTVSLAAPVLILAAGTVSLWHASGLSHPPLRFPNPRNQFRVETYRDVANYLNRVGAPTDTIASPEIGALGFYSRNHLYDACGLVTPEAIPFLPAPHGRRVGPDTGSISADFARAVNADWIVTMEKFGVESLFDDPWFKENYALERVFPLRFETFESRHVLVYRHK